MLVIRREQIAAFVHDRDVRFADLISRDLRASGLAAAVQLPEEELQQRVLAALARGRAWGIQSPTALWDFIAAAFQISPLFDQHPRVREILGDSSIPPDARMAEVLRRLDDQDWLEIRNGRTAGSLGASA